MFCISTLTIRSYGEGPSPDAAWKRFKSRAKVKVQHVVSSKEELGYMTRGWAGLKTHCCFIANVHPTPPIRRYYLHPHRPHYLRHLG